MGMNNRILFGALSCLDQKELPLAPVNDRYEMRKYKYSSVLLLLVAAAVLWWAAAAKLPDNGISLSNEKNSLNIKGSAGISLISKDKNTGQESLVSSSYRNDALVSYLALAPDFQDLISGNEAPSVIRYRIISRDDSLIINGVMENISGPLYYAGYSAVQKNDTLIISFQFIKDKGTATGDYNFRMNQPADNTSSVLVSEVLPPSIKVIETLYKLDADIYKELLEPSPGYSESTHRIDPSFRLKVNKEMEERIILLSEAYQTLFKIIDDRLSYLNTPGLSFPGREQQISNLIFWKEETHRHILELLTSVRFYTLAGNFTVNEEETLELDREKKEYLSLKNYYSRILRF